MDPPMVSVTVARFCGGMTRMPLNDVWFGTDVAPEAASIPASVAAYDSLSAAAAVASVSVCRCCIVARI